MPAWPASLPQDQFLGTRVSLGSNVLRSPMGVGPDKLRRRHTADVRDVRVPIVLTGLQFAALITFYRTDLAEVLPFTWEDPRSDATVNYRFVQPPGETLVAGDATADERLWQGDLILEIVP